MRSLIAALLLAGSSTLTAATELFDSCEAAGASKYEPGYEDIGPVDVGTFFPYDAIDNCTAALAEDPQNAQIMAWLGNAYAAAAP